MVGDYICVNILGATGFIQRSQRRWELQSWQSRTKLKMMRRCSTHGGTKHELRWGGATCELDLNNEQEHKIWQATIFSGLRDIERLSHDAIRHT